MRILFVIVGLGVGGAEKVVTSLSDRLAEQGHKVKIAYLTGPALVLPKNSNIEVFSLNVTGVIGFFKAYFKLIYLIKKFSPDVVHSHMFHSNILTRLVRIFKSIPKLICTAHSNNEGGRLRMLAYRVTDKLADISTNVSEQAVDSFIEKNAVKSGRMISIANGIDADIFNYNDSLAIITRKELDILNNNKMILTVGRLSEPKDYPNLFYAVSILKAIRQDFKIFIAGDGPLRVNLEKLILKLEINNYIEFLGVRHDIPALMSAADVFVLASAWEGFGLVVAEAMACERVVVATDSGGVKEVLGDAGLLVPTQSPELLAAALQKALDMGDEEKKLLGKEGRARVISHYSLDAAVQKWLRLYI